MSDDLRVGGYLFGTAADAALGKEELEKIRYLDSNMNYSNALKVMQLYDKSLDSKMFRTPIGWDYLNKLKLVLIDSGFLESEIRPIPVYSVFARAEEDITPLSQRVKPIKKKPDTYKNRFAVSVLVIVVLIITIITMFIITMQAETPNMLNYRNAIVNEYAEWEQDIKDREDAVRKRERELSLPSPLPHEQQKASSKMENE